MCALALFFFQCSGDPRDLHSFPTRRSSDLNGHGLLLVVDKFPSANTLEVTRGVETALAELRRGLDRKSTRLNSSHITISYAVFCLKKKKQNNYAIISINRHRSVACITSSSY